MRKFANEQDRQMHDAALTAPAELQSRILTRRSRRPLQGLPPRRLDHINLMASDVTEQKGSR